MNDTVYKDTLKFVKDVVDFFNYLVEQYGEVKIVKYGSDIKERKNYKYHDFIYFCFSKSVRSLYASIDLAEKCFREDCLIILRTVYENYLHISHVLKNPEMIQEYVEQTVGLDAGIYKYKIDKNGRKNYKIIINVNTLREYKYSTNNGTRARFSINKLDFKIHQSIYKYLSEHIHPNMMGSGNYRSKDHIHYLAEPQYIYLEVPFLLVYICYILSEAMYYYHTEYSEINGETLSMLELTEYNSIMDRLRNQIFELLKICELEQELKKEIISRIKNVS